MSKWSEHTASGPLARLLGDKRAAAVARGALIERMKRNAAPPSPLPEPEEKPVSGFANWPPPTVDEVDCAEPASTNDGGIASSGAVTVEEVLKTADISVRLANRIEINSLFREWTVASARMRRQEFITALLRLKDMGRKTVNEVTELLDRYAERPWIVGEKGAQRFRGDIPLNTPLIEILRTSPLSDSLGGSLLEDILGDLTVQDYVADRNAVIARLRRLPSVPKRREAEADMVSALDSALDIAADEISPIMQEMSLRIEQIRDEPIVDVLRRHDVSVRLENMLVSGVIDHIRVGDFIRDQEETRKLLLSVRNSGRRTADEAIRILSAHVDGIPDAADDGDVDSSSDASGTELTDAALPPRERVLNAIHSLADREAQVLRWRYGLDGGAVRTLQDIAEEVHVTRERVRQVEKKALRRLQKGPARFALNAFIEAERESQWIVLAGADGRLSEDNLPERARKLDPLFQIALDATVGGAKKWLDDFTRRQPDGWARDSIQSEHRSQLLERIDKLIREIPTPTPFFSLRAEIGDEAGVIVRLSSGAKGWTIFEEYLCTGYLGAKVRRTVRLHLIACLISENSLFDIGSLVRNYRDMFPEDDAGSRVIQMQLEDAPHLFASFFDGIWLILPPTSQNPSLDSLPFERSPVRKDDEFSEESTGARILRFLEASGPQRRSEIVNDATADGDTLKASVSATIAMNPCFRRVAPGFYGLYRGDGELRERLRPSLLNESQCRHYCFARHSGAPADYFPAWGADFEMDLVLWAQTSAPSELLRSLLSIIEPRDWPIPANLASEMLAVTDRESRWSIGSARSAPLGHRFIDPEQFLSILAHLAIFGWIGWCAVNRLSGALLNQNDAADVLAFLMLTGLVEPQHDWQACHLATPLASRVFRDATERRHRVGRLAWDDDVLAPIIEGIDAPQDSIGWVAADEIRPAIKAWRSGQLSCGRAYGGGATAPPDVEETFISPEWESLFGAAS